MIVKPIDSELGLRETAWIAHNRAVVDKLSGRPHRLCLHVGHGAAGPAAVHAAVLRPARQAGADHGRPLERRRLHRALCPGAPAPGPRHPRHQPRARSDHRAAGGAERAQGRLAEPLVRVGRRHLPLCSTPMAWAS
ncbi:MAG: hypothetical protein WDM92_02400 [Caulobacteraceae bacterium]